MQTVIKQSLHFKNSISLTEQLIILIYVLFLYHLVSLFFFCHLTHNFEHNRMSLKRRKNYRDQNSSCGLIHFWISSVPPGELRDLTCPILGHDCLLSHHFRFTNHITIRQYDIGNELLETSSNISINKQATLSNRGNVYLYWVFY